MGYRVNYLIPLCMPNTINLAQLLAGSEGTLGIIRTATLRLVPLKKHTILSVINFSSIIEACDSVTRILELSPSAIELIPQSLIHLARSVPAYANQLSFVMGDPAAMLVVEFSGDDQRQLIDQISKLKSIKQLGY